MTQTPQFIFDKNRFVRAIDTVWDFNRALFDCVAGIKSENIKDKMAFQDVEAVVHDTKKFSELWKLQYNAQIVEDKIYLNQLVFFIRKNPNSPQTKAFIDLWNAIYLLFPHKSRPLDSVAAFKVFADLPNILPDIKAQYHVLHAFAYNAGLTKESDIKRALTVIANNENAEVADLKELLNMRNEIGRKKEVVDLKPGEKMPDINDLSQFPHYAKLLKQVKEQEK